MKSVFHTYVASNVDGWDIGITDHFYCAEHSSYVRQLELKIQRLEEEKKQLAQVSGAALFFFLLSYLKLVFQIFIWDIFGCTCCIH